MRLTSGESQEAERYRVHGARNAQNASQRRGRCGGQARAQVADSVSGQELLAFIKENVDPVGSVLMTDEFSGYCAVRHTISHAVIKHRETYVEGVVHANTAEVHGMNRLYYGDCLAIIRDHMRLSSVDLIYLDPPFNSNREYNAIYKIEAFCDLWTLDEQRERAIRNMPVLMPEVGVDDQVTKFWKLWMNALRNTQPRLLAYLSYMVERLIHMRPILKPTGSIYLHCDPTASHYIKVMMDAILGHTNFGNEIIWHYKRWPAGDRNFQRMHDVILRYRAGHNATFNVQFQPFSGKTIHRKMSVDGRTDLAETRDHNRGTKMDDVWDIPYLHSPAKERMGYATQKPLALLDRIIKASFVVVPQHLKRRTG